jgi:hypothetical protein
LGLFTKHPTLNYFRGEILFSGNLDKYPGINFTKNGVKLNQSASDQLHQFLDGQITTIRKRHQRKEQANVPSDVAEVHKSAEQEIHKKSKLLAIPRAPKETRSPQDDQTKKQRDRKESERGREPGAKQQSGGHAANVRFEAVNLGTEGPYMSLSNKVELSLFGGTRTIVSTRDLC